MAIRREPRMRIIPAIGQLPALRLHALHYREAGQDWQVEDHVHPWWQWYCTVTGEVPLRIDGRDHPLSTEEWVLIRPGSVRAIGPVDPGSGYLVALFHLDGIDLSPIAERTLPLPDPLRSDFHALLDELRRLDERRERDRSALGGALRATLVTRLLLGLLRSGGEAAPDAPAPAGADRREDFAARTEAWMSAHLHRQLTREAIASAMGLSAPHFARLIRAATGETPLKRLTRLRLERARALLLETARPITLIAGDVGFQSFSHFSSLFRAEVGLTPSDYRRLRGRVWGG